ncbi:MAG TPA: hypothetical protein ENK99_00165 [Campylobacterales bacterium]|nr:hypothetical protein [Campylobacterales bacterium]
MNEQLLDKIYINLHDVESSVESLAENFRKENIPVDRFLAIIRLYISSFDLLKKFKDKNLLILLNKKLVDILNSYEHISLYIPKIKSSINFIEKSVDKFFPTETQNTTLLSNSYSYMPPKKKISFLNKITIKHFFSLDELILNNLKDNKEIYIVGENGDGKTLLLQAIAVGLKGTVEDGLKEFRAREEKFTVEIEDKDKIENNFFA